MSRTLAIALLISVLCSLCAIDASACSTCFGDENSPQTHGMNAAIITMLGTTYFLFAGMVAMAFFLWRKARLAAEPHAEDEAEVPAGEIAHG